MPFASPAHDSVIEYGGFATDKVVPCSRDKTGWIVVVFGRDFGGVRCWFVHANNDVVTVDEFALLDEIKLAATDECHGFVGQIRGELGVERDAWINEREYWFCHIVCISGIRRIVS